MDTVTEQTSGEQQEPRRADYCIYAPYEGFVEELQGKLMEFLMSVHKEHIHPQLAYCLQELLDNAVRANLKRLYFDEKHMDLQNRKQYEQGLVSFKEVCSSEREDWFSKLRKLQKYTVRVEFSITPGHLTMAVTNNAQILPYERDRIDARINKARIHESVAEIFDEVSDDSESGGLGIVMLCMLLRKLGLPENCFILQTSESETSVGIHVPLGSLTEEESEAVSEALAGELNSIPQFPDHVLALKRLLSSGQTDFHAVAALLKRDPALTAEVLRMCNSAYYRRKERIESSQLALSILGVRGLRSILESFGARQALEKRFSRKVMDRLWEHSRRVAAITSFLCTRYAVPAEQNELAYNGALLHEIGRIVLEGRHPTTCAALDSLCERKAVSVNAVEQLIEGVNHAIIGSALAAHWNLPESLVHLIKFYRTPRSAPPDIQKTCAIVYLAHTLVERETGEVNEFQPEHLPEHLGLSVNDTLTGLLESMRGEDIEPDE